MKWTWALLLVSSIAFAKADLAKLVPQGKVISQTKLDAKVKTPAGTEVEIGIDDEGELEEASGLAATKGDVFEPGQKLLSLKAAVEALAKAGKQSQGEWTFEENEEGEWIYDFEGTENNKPVDYILNATTGKLIKTEIDE